VVAVPGGTAGDPPPLHADRLTATQAATALVDTSTTRCRRVVVAATGAEGIVGRAGCRGAAAGDRFGCLVAAVVILEALAIGVLGLLVAGLLRSHAEILRRLHHLGAGLDLDGPDPPVGPADGSPCPTALTGMTPWGEAVTIALDRPGARTVLLFLSSGCGTCAPWWDGMRHGAHRRALAGTRVVVVARDEPEESPALLRGLAPDDVTVVQSSAAWDAFGVPGSPYAVLVGGGRVVGEGVAHGWDQLGSLIARHLRDLASRRDTDEELLAAGLRPGDPSLHPAPASWTRPPR
jgi:hypothetical protein